MRGLTLKVDVWESGSSCFDPSLLRICGLELLYDVMRDEASVVVRRRPPDVRRGVLHVLHDRSARSVRTIIHRDLGGRAEGGLGVGEEVGEVGDVTMKP